MLLLTGAEYNAISLGISLLLPGISFLLSPPKKGLGQSFDRIVLLFIASLLFAFLPNFYWPDAGWRIAAREAVSLDLPIGLSVQPWNSIESWLMVLAGFGWFYAALNWRLNSGGRRRLFFCLSLILLIWAGMTAVENPERNPAMIETGMALLGSFQKWDSTVNLLVPGGVVTFAYGMDSFRLRRVTPLIGLFASFLCLTALFLGGSRFGVILYFLGVSLCFIITLRSRLISRRRKIVFSFVYLAVVGGICSQIKWISEFNDLRVEVEADYTSRMAVYSDTLDLIRENPLTGVGLGSFSAIFPQYRDASANHQPILHPESDLLWLASEGGLLAVALFGIFLFAYFRKCRGIKAAPDRRFHLFALIVVGTFLLYTLVDVPMHQPGIVYVLILFAVLAISDDKCQPFRLSPVFWRVGGLGFVVIGMLWIVSGLGWLSFHSSTRVQRYQEALKSSIEAERYDDAKQNANHWLALHPMDWRAYTERAKMTLLDGGDKNEAIKDFERARFVEPNLGVVTYEEGLAWIDGDKKRAIDAWYDTLLREVENPGVLFKQMLYTVRKSPDRTRRMARISEIDPYYRSLLLTYLRSNPLMQQLELELSRDPELSKYSSTQRTEIVRNWIQHGDLKSAETFLREHEKSLSNVWWLWSLLRKEQSDTQDALKYLRSRIEVIPVVESEIEIDREIFERFSREYALAPNNWLKGRRLIYACLEQGKYEQAVSVLEKMLQSDSPPVQLYYWFAESLYRAGKYRESWSAFETYFEKTLKEDPPDV